MNKLTTISTIKKAAPLALLAVVMSGSAFAGPGKGNGPKDKGPKGEPQASVSVVTNCSLCDPNAEGYDPANYVNCDYSKTDPVLYVSATITDETGDVMEPVDLDLDVNAYVTRKDKGPRWYRIPTATPILGASGSGTWDTTLNLCDFDASIGDAKAVSAIVEVEVVNFEASKDVYSSRCENFDPDPDTDEDEDYIDQSNFDISALGISCD
jgi:hypothetical protein